ncbi:hypothetical protein L7F22_039866 [Adiantum nelumboides]|nr:hypothetical protein [Adiantum nelumboides]
MATGKRVPLHKIKQPIPTLHEVGETSGQVEEAFHMQLATDVTLFKQLMDNSRFMEFLQSPLMAQQVQENFPLLEHVEALFQIPTVSSKGKKHSHAGESFGTERLQAKTNPLLCSNCFFKQIYQHQHSKKMSCPAMAQLLSNTLYYKRFFPYYAFNVLGGLDSEGKGCVFTYDAVGSYERVGYSSQGSGQQLLMPVLDNQLQAASPLLLPSKESATPLSEGEAVDLIMDVFASAAERDIYTGDAVEIVVVNAEGIKRQTMELRKD